MDKCQEGRIAAGIVPTNSISFLALLVGMNCSGRSVTGITGLHGDYQAELRMFDICAMIGQFSMTCSRHAPSTVSFIRPTCAIFRDRSLDYGEG